MKVHAALGALLPLFFVACAGSEALPPPQAAAALPPVEVSEPQVDISGLHVLMLNGGGSPAINYQSHVLSMQGLRKVLLDAGVSPTRISTLSSDGADPKPDLAVRASPPQNDPSWLVEGTRFAQLVERPTESVDSRQPDARPATRDELTHWFAAAKSRIRPGETLLFFVTDHGTMAKDPANNAITLWGKGESITVAELGALIDTLDPGVRVVTLMSQCFSGAFAALAMRPGAGVTRPTFCGYFSSTADRPAYGCYPENLGDATVGHAYEFTQALSATKTMEDAHQRVLASDITPDVPLRSSDVYLAGLVEQVLAARHVSPDALFSELTSDAAQLEGAQTRLSRLASAFGLPTLTSPASLAALQTEVGTLQRDAEASAKAWQQARTDAAASNLSAFFTQQPSWTARLAEPAVAALTPAERKNVGDTFLSEVSTFTQNLATGPLPTLHDRAEQAAEIAYRAEVREAVALRARTQLYSLMGRAHLERSGTGEELAIARGLSACESLALPGHPAGPAPQAPASDGAGAGSRPAFPALADDVALERRTHPSWLGIGFSDLNATLRQQKSLPLGASMVTSVYPGSPAERAGLTIGDIALGAPGAPFTLPRHIRFFTMLSPAGQPTALEILRGEEQLTLSLTLTPLSPNPQPPPRPPVLGVSSAAPALGLKAYRGAAAESLTNGRSHLLYFWATWCKPCKAAVPELLAYQKKTGVKVIAITDEDNAVLDPFFKTFQKPFPQAVGSDPMRKSFLAYGVTGTPTFILVDGKGVIRARTVGYGTAKGLGIDGWKWNGK